MTFIHITHKQGGKRYLTASIVSVQPCLLTRDTDSVCCCCPQLLSWSKTAADDGSGKTNAVSCLPVYS